MALPIASIPVLTGEVALRFEAEAQANYRAVSQPLGRTEERQTRQFLKRSSPSCTKCWLKPIWDEDELFWKNNKRKTTVTSLQKHRWALAWCTMTWWKPWKNIGRNTYSFLLPCNGDIDRIQCWTKKLTIKKQILKRLYNKKNGATWV